MPDTKPDACAYIVKALEDPTGTKRALFTCGKSRAEHKPRAHKLSLFPDPKTPKGSACPFCLPLGHEFIAAVEAARRSEG